MKVMKPIILAIDDEQAILELLKQILTDEGFYTETLLGGKNALNVISKLSPDIILLDIFMPNCNGLELLATIKQQYPGPRVIIMSGYGNIPLAVEALHKGADDFIEKPFSIEDLLLKIQVATAPSVSDTKTSTAEAECGMIGKSYLFRELIDQATRLGALNLPVLMYGLRGVGKTVLSQYMHRISPYKNNELHCINARTCEGVESLWPQLQKEDTVIIQNIDALDATEQLKLLNLLEHPARQARIIALTSKPLFKLTQDGAFNADLFAFLNVVPLEIPPLHKRRIDIPLLTEYFLGQANQQLNKNCAFTSASLRAISNHVWPGNCKSLQQFVMAAVASTPPAGSIDEEHVKQLLLLHHEAHIDQQYFAAFASLDDATKNFQKKFLLYHLKKNSYDLDQVSHILDLTLPDLHHALVRLDITV